MVDLRAMRAGPDRDAIVTALSRNSITRAAVSPFVAGEGADDAARVAREVLLAGMAVSVRPLLDPAGREPALPAYVATIAALADAEVSPGADLLVDLGALQRGRLSDPIGWNSDVAQVSAAAAEAGMTITLTELVADQVDTGLLLQASLGGMHPDLGLTVSANLLRSEADCGDLARAGARVRLVTGSPAAAGLAFTDRHEVDMAFVRCMRVLMSEGGRPIIASDDRRLIEIAGSLAVRNDRDPGSYAVQIPLGVRSQAAAELVASGSTVVVVVPFGPDWPSYVARRVGVTPGSLSRALRAVVGR